MEKKLRVVKQYAMSFKLDAVKLMLEEGYKRAQSR